MCSLMETGRTVWRVEKAERLAFLVDARSYFTALTEALQRARESVLILAWDIDSELRLFRDDEQEEHGHPVKLAPLLSHILRERPQLHIHVLCWDYSSIYTLEREFLQRFKMGWMTHERLHFQFDNSHPPGASHHDKMVVIDDHVAFIGGIDLGRRRWDTSAHHAEDERRISPVGRRYPPFHDMQAIVQGPLAAALGEHARRRWRQATGDVLSPPGDHGDAWPKGVDADIEDLEVGIVRTRAAYHDQPELSETKALLQRMIEGSQELIFVENQYLTSESVCAALTKRLQAPNPPEMLLLTALENAGWLEKTIMGGLRAGFCRRLRQADPGGRVQVMYPRASPEVAINVHTKLMVVDDRWAYLGSANLSNRSMGLDSECGLALDGSGRPEVCRALAGLRRRLLAEHLDVETDELTAARRRCGSLLEAVNDLSGGSRTLCPLAADEDEIPTVLEPVAELADPKHAPRILDFLHDLF